MTVYTFMEPKIIFRVDLSVTDAASSEPPYARGVDADYIKYTRSTFIPGLQQENLVLKHGDEITLYGQQARYLYNLIQKNLLPPLKVVRIADFYYDIGYGGIGLEGEAEEDYVAGGSHNVYDIVANESFGLSYEDGSLLEGEDETFTFTSEEAFPVFVGGEAELPD